jgi:cellulose synthase/poly-beta-1,6-N-acetylglucosamine synthase-like glycosyltransferase
VKYPKFYFLENESSKSKAENVNAAIDFLQSKSVEYVSLFDADHTPDPFSFANAISEMKSRNLDFGQGVIVPRYEHRHWLWRLVRVEIEINFICHSFTSHFIRGWALCQGSNCWFRFEILNKVRFNPGFIGEDLTWCFAAHLNYPIRSGGLFVFSHEDLPPTLGSLIDQRIRWEQGIFQSLIHHFIPLMITSRLSLRQKITFFIHLPFRISFWSYGVPMFLVLGWSCGDRMFGHSIGWVALISFVHVMTWWVSGHKWSLLPFYFLYTVIQLPVEICRAATVLMGHVQHLLGRRKWDITPREVSKVNIV